MISVLAVASEAYPLVKTGGLADVVGALPGALAPHGVAVATLLPGYTAVMEAITGGAVIHRYNDLLGVPARLIEAQLSGYPLLVLDAPQLFSRVGGIYGDRTGKDWPDNWRRFAALGRAGADLASGALTGRQFDILHAHDWQAGMAPAYLRYGPAPRPASVLTVHNIAFQGRFERPVFESLGLPPASYALDGVEYYGGVGFLKAGLASADAITTVSPRYADEIKTTAFGMGLEGLIRTRSDIVTGIVNGIDPAIWNPQTDAALPAPFGVGNVGRRRANKRAMEQEFGLARGDGPLFTVISRLTEQKGMDVLVNQLDGLVALGGRLALLGSGDKTLEAKFAAAAERHTGRIGVKIGYDEILSHRLQGGADAILIPSRFEPCGLTQLYGLAYGCVPVAARTGGLADTIIDANQAALDAGVATGVLFDGVTADNVLRAIQRATTLYQQPKLWRAMQLQGMKADFSWRQSGAHYAALFEGLVEARRPSEPAS
jgi:starch synthase